MHRPTVRSVLQGLLRKRLLPIEHGVAKAKKIIQNCNNATASSTPKDDSSSPCHNASDPATTMKISLRCPLTFRRMTLPARGHDCRHLQCFDLESYLKSNGERQGAAWKCPVCNKPALLEGLEVDQFTWSIVQTPQFADVDEVSVDAQATVTPIVWRPPIKPEIKDDNSSSPSHHQQQHSPMSPGDLKVPNLALWEIPSSSRSPALYAPPDMNSEFLSICLFWGDT